MYRLSAAHAALAALLLCDGVQGFSLAPSFIPKSSLLHPSCKAGGHASALGLGMVMTSGSKADATKKVPEVPEVPGAKVGSFLAGIYMRISCTSFCLIILFGLL
jgi:hypothetical protein